MKPVIQEDASQRLQDIIEMTEKEFNHEVKISAGEATRIDLIRRMKEDTDKKEYMIMLNILMAAVMVSAAAHYFYYKSIFAIGCMIVAFIFFVFIRQRLKTVTVELGAFKNDFDKYLWEGFYLKEMRYTAVKLCYILFFPLFTILVTDLFSESTDDNGSFWISLLIALTISTLGWMIYFSDDQKSLDKIEADLKSLQYL